MRIKVHCILQVKTIVYNNNNNNNIIIIIIIIVIMIIMIIKDAYRGLNDGRLDDWCLHLEIYHKTILMFRE